MTRTQAIEQALETLIASVEAHQYGTGTLREIRKCADEARTIKNLPDDTAPPSIQQLIAELRELVEYEDESGENLPIYAETMIAIINKYEALK